MKRIKRFFKRLKRYFNVAHELLFLNGILNHIPSYKIRYFFYKRSGMEIGENTAIFRKSYLQALNGIKVGSATQIGFYCRLDGRGLLHIGNNVNISSYSILETGGHSFETFEATFNKIKIEDHVWIGTHAIILGGVTVGEGAVIGSGSVVVKDVAPYTIVAGNPARFIKNRPTKIDYLLKGKPIFH